MKVSVLIPVHNAERFLLATLNSVRAQSWKDIEVILVDDGSTDHSLAIAEAFSLSYPIKILKQTSSGACSARNRAFRESTGDYILFLDADDLLSPDKIKNQIEAGLLYANDIVLSSSVVRFKDEQELTNIKVRQEFLDRDWNNPLDWLYHSWTGRGVGQTSSWLTPRSLIERAGPWNETLLINQDGEFFCRVLIVSKGIKYCMNSEVYYRTGNMVSVSQLMSNKKIEDLLRSYRLYQEHVLKVDASERMRWAIAYNYQSFIYLYYDEYRTSTIKAQACLKELLLSKYPIAGSIKFKYLAGVVGFITALKLRRLIGRLVNSDH